MWGGSKTSIDVLVKPQFLDKVSQKFRESGIEYEVTIEDLQRAMDVENPSVIELDDRRGRYQNYF